MSGTDHYSGPAPLANWLSDMQEEFNGFMLGDLIGNGMTRAVYEVPALPDKWVYKIEAKNDQRYFCNVMEWALWQDSEKNPEARNWLAPCWTISKNGRILIQARTKPCPPSRIPDLVPDFLSDCHDNNFGLYKGRVVCHDYAFNRSIEKAGKRFKLVRRDKL